MRHAPIPAHLFTVCPTCGDKVAAAIPPEDRRCPHARGTVSFDITADTTAFNDALTGKPRPPAAGAAATVTLDPWQQQLLAYAAAGQQVYSHMPRRSSRTLTLNAIEAAREAPHA